MEGANGRPFQWKTIATSVFSLGCSTDSGKQGLLELTVNLPH